MHVHVHADTYMYNLHVHVGACVYHTDEAYMYMHVHVQAIKQLSMVCRSRLFKTHARAYAHITYLQDSTPGNSI